MRERRNASAQTVCILTIFLIFSVASLLLVLSSVDAYDKVSDISTNNSQLRATLSYISNKIKVNDSNGGIRITEHDGVEVLEISEMIDGYEYMTLLYWYNGELLEQFIYSEDEFRADYGESVTRIAEFDMNIENENLLSFYAKTEDGIDDSIFVSVS